MQLLPCGTMGVLFKHMEFFQIMYENIDNAPNSEF